MKLNLNWNTDVAQKQVISQALAAKTEAFVKDGGIKGSTFEGQIVDVRGKDVSIRVGNELIHAILDAKMTFNIGDKISFLIKENTGSTLYIKPLANQSQTTGFSLAKILQGAYLPINERTLEAADELLKHGMPVDKHTMNEVYKLLNQFPETDVKTLISMKSHQIPIHAENIEQFQRYQNHEEKLLDGMQDFVSRLNAMAEDTQTLPQFQQNRELFDKILQILESLSENKVQGETGSTQNASGADTKNPSDIQIIGESPEKQFHTKTVPEEQPKAENFLKPNNLQEQNQPAKVVIGMDGLPESVLEQGKAELKEIAGQIEKQMLEKFLITPEKLARQGEETIKDTYEKLAKTAQKLLETLQNGGGEQTKLMQSAGDLKNNLNFMGDMNQMAAYVQLPMKLNGGEKTGELYVLNRNRNKNAQDGSKTAFLHLDMEHLGNVDARVSLLKEQVHTKFTLEQEDSIKLFEEHLPELQKKLEELGYRVDVKVEEIPKEEKTPFEQILELDKPRQQMKRFSFDVRM